MTDENHNSHMSPFLKPEMVALELGISTNVVYRWIKRGELRAINMAPDPALAKHAFYRVHRDWLQDFLDRRTNRGPSTPPAPPSPPRQRDRRRNPRPRRDHFAD
jgi:hypothetical protein